MWKNCNNNEGNFCEVQNFAKEGDIKWIHWGESRTDSVGGSTPCKLNRLILLYNSFRFTRIHTLVLGKVSKPVFLFEINTLSRPNSLMAEHFAPHSLACEQALQVWRVKRTAVFFRVRLSGDYSRLPQMESLLVGFSLLNCLRKHKWHMSTRWREGWRSWSIVQRYELLPTPPPSKKRPWPRIVNC